MSANFVCRSLCVFVVLVFAFAVDGARAQIQNPIQAARDAYNKAKQQQQKQGQAQPQAATQAQSSAQASSDCCTPEMIKKIAVSTGFLDVVGVKLGMTPEQAFTAIKTFNPKMKIDIIKARMETPDNPGSFTRVS